MRGPTPGRNCYTCQHFGGVWSKFYVHCEQSGNIGSHPNEGCAFWTREPGSDDEPLHSHMPELHAAETDRWPARPAAPAHRR